MVALEAPYGLGKGWGVNKGSGEAQWGGPVGRPRSMDQDLRPAR